MIGGFTTAGDSNGALLVGDYTPEATCVADSVGTGNGFTREFLRELRNQLSAIIHRS